MEARTGGIKMANIKKADRPSAKKGGLTSQIMCFAGPLWGGRSRVLPHVFCVVPNLVMSRQDVSKRAGAALYCWRGQRKKPKVSKKQREKKKRMKNAELGRIFR